MTVAELIELLKDLEQDKPIVYFDWGTYETQDIEKIRCEDDLYLIY